MTPQTGIMPQTTPTTDDFQYSHKQAVADPVDATNRIMEDLQRVSGISVSADIAHSMYESIRDFCQSDYGRIRNAYSNPQAPFVDRERMRLIDEYVRHAPKWVGSIYRGISVSQSDANRIVSDPFVDMQGPSSWSNEMPVAESFARSENREIALLFVLKDNKSGVSVAHISPYELQESEVIVPSGVKYKVNRVTEGVVDGRRWMYVFLSES